MCWTSRKLDEHVATKDITAYKVVIPYTRSCTSLFWKFNYEYNKLYTTSFTIHAFDFGFYITEGFHSYKIVSQARKLNRLYREHVIRCVIPKGSHYFINSDDEIVSDKIIIIG